MASRPGPIFLLHMTRNVVELEWGKMGDDADRLRVILAKFAHDPDDAGLWPAARELADRFTLDQLCAMAASHAGDVKRMFDRILGRTARRESSGGWRAHGAP
jgi:hypothetical protein